MATIRCRIILTPTVQTHPVFKFFYRFLFYSLSLFLQMVSCPFWIALALSLPASPSPSLLFQITSGTASLPFSVFFRPLSLPSLFSWKPSLFLHTMYSAKLCLSNASALSRATTSSLLFQMISSSPPPSCARPFSRLSCLTVPLSNILNGQPRPSASLT